MKITTNHVLRVTCTFSNNIPGKALLHGIVAKHLCSLLKCPGNIYTDPEMSTIQKTGISHIINHNLNKKEVLVNKC